MLGAADPQGPEGAVGRTGGPPSFTSCCPFPSGPAFPCPVPQPRLSLQGSLSHKLASQALWSMACGRAIRLVPALSGVLNQRGDQRKTQSRDAQVLSELAFCLQLCVGVTANPAPFPKCPGDELDVFLKGCLLSQLTLTRECPLALATSSRLEPSLLVTPATVPSIHYTKRQF